MTSKRAARCFVYIWLPGATTAVTAGRFELTKDRAGVAVGRFVYGKSYLARPEAVPFDPVELVLADRVYETTLNKGVFGALRDSSPDYWGRLVIDRHLGTAGSDEITYLLQSPDDRAGALGFGLGQAPPAPKRQFNRTLDLGKLQEAADLVLADRAPEGPDAEQLDKLMLLGTSMGGMRPKAVVEDRGALWLAKFNKPTDRWNNARVERAMLVLARAAGIATAESKLATIGDRDVLMVKRFDREKVRGGYARARMTSAVTVLRTDDEVSSRGRWSYILLAEELRRITAEPKRAAHELFRRIAFNALVSNIDDHPRNHAIIARDKAWGLSPAYDLTPAVPVSISRRDLAMQCGNQGRWANAGNLLSECARFLLTREAATAIIDQVEAVVVAGWYRTLKEHGVTEREAEMLKGAFAYPGFRMTDDAVETAMAGEPPPSVEKPPVKRKSRRKGRGNSPVT